MPDKRTIRHILIALALICTGIAVGLYGGWRMETAVLASRHISTVGLGLALAIAGTASLVKAARNRKSG